MRKLLGMTGVLMLVSWVASNSVADERGAPVQAAKRSGIAISISVKQKMLEQRLRVLVSFEFKNTSKKKERLESWLALEPAEVTLAVLRVLGKNGEAVRYIGDHVHRMEPTPSDFLVLEPGQSRLVSDVDVTDCYYWPETAQRLTIWFEAYSASHRRLELLESDRVEFDYQPVVARPGIPREKLVKKRRGARPAQLPESSPRPQ
jgi:hypothetical protein